MGKDDSRARTRARGCLPICDQQLLGQTPKDYSAQSLESADEAATGHLITNAIIPPGDRSATSFKLPGGLGRGGGRTWGLEQCWGNRVMMKAAGLTFLWMLKVLAGKAHCPSWALVLGLRADVGSAKRGGGGSRGDPAASQAGWAVWPWHPFQQLWATALGQTSFTAFGPGNTSSGVS